MAEKRYEKNQLVTLEVEDIGSEGEGIGHVDGYALFVKDAVPGDVIEAKILKAKKNYAYARLEKVLEPSPFRVPARCKDARACGGCQLQALSYEKELELKARKVRGNLIRIGGFAAEEIDGKTEAILGMDDPWHYRNKAQYPIGTDREGNLIAGFYAGRTHSIIPNLECHLGSEINGVLLEAILDWMKAHHISAYDETEHQGLVRHVLLREGFATGEVMVCLVINGKGLPEQEDLVQRILKCDLGNRAVKSISFSSNTSDTNVIMGKSYDVIYGQGYIEDTIGQVRFRISPLSFYQVNPAQTFRLYSQALEYADLQGSETVWDLYCGIGTISLFLAQRAGKVCGVEIIPQAIDNARENAAINGIKNAEFFVGAAESVLPAFYAGELTEVSGGSKEARKDEDFLHPDVIVVDPPRKGCDEACLNTMLQMAPDRIVYVSCDSATLARDLRILCDGGYEIRKIRPVDMFPHTVHVETVVLLSQQKPDDMMP